MPLLDEAISSHLAKDSILEGPYWPEPVRVLVTKVRDERIDIKAVGVQTERYYNSVQNLTDVEANVHVQAQRTTTAFTANPLHFRLAIEAQGEVLPVRLSPNEWLKAAGGLAVAGDVLALHCGGLRQRAPAVSEAA